MIYRKAKWKLAKSKIISIFLKAVKPKVEENSYKNNKKKNKNNRVLFNVGENSKNNDDNLILSNMKNKTTLDKLYKRKGNNQKLVKGALGKKGKSNNYLYDTQEDDSDNSSFIQNNKKIEKESGNISRGDGNSNNKLFFDLLNNKSYDNGRKDEAFKSINSNSNNNSNNSSFDKKQNYENKNKYIINSDYLDDYFKNNYHRRIDRRGYTSGYRRSPNNREYLLEENKKNINKVKSKKAKIIKFKSHKDNFDVNDYKESHGFLYDYIHNKKYRTINKQNDNYELKKRLKSNIELPNIKDSRGNSKSRKKKNVSENKINDNYNYNKKVVYTEAFGSKKNTRNTSAKKDRNKKHRVKVINNIDNSTNNNKHNYTINNSKDKHLNTLSNNPISVLMKNRKIVTDTNSKISLPKLNNSQYIFPKKIMPYDNSGNKKSSNSKIKLIKKHTHAESLPEIPKQNHKMKHNTVFREIEMLGVDAVKSKFKKKLIQINDHLHDAIHYYNGPIDISCISSKNYMETVLDLKKKVSKNGFKCIQNKTYYFKFTNGIDSFLVEIVKIRNNMLYYLVLKSQ
jgi:hypothetical protein